MLAASLGNIEVVDTLLKNGATALKLAKIKVIEDLLIAFGSKE